MKSISTLGMSREEWLKQRQVLGIGGSDVAAALGISQYTTPYQLASGTEERKNFTYHISDAYGTTLNFTAYANDSGNLIGYSPLLQIVVQMPPDIIPPDEYGYKNKGCF